MRRAMLRCASASPYHCSHPRELQNAAAETPSAASAAATSRQSLERRALLEFPIARLDFRPRKIAEAVHAKFLATETAHDRAVNHGAPQFFEPDVAVIGRDALSGEIADESAGEA